MSLSSNVETGSTSEFVVAGDYIYGSRNSFKQNDRESGPFLQNAYVTILILRQRQSNTASHLLTFTNGT